MYSFLTDRSVGPLWYYAVLLAPGNDVYGLRPPLATKERRTLVSHEEQGEKETGAQHSVLNFFVFISQFYSTVQSNLDITRGLGGPKNLSLYRNLKNFF